MDMYVKIHIDGQGRVVGATLEDQGMLVLCTEIEQNEMFDPDRTHNGGGYHQPLWDIEIPTMAARIQLCDLSCGDFGSRYSAEVSIGGNIVADASWGTMNEGSCHSSFDENTARFAAIMYAVTGVQPPWKDEIDNGFDYYEFVR